MMNWKKLHEVEVPEFTMGNMLQYFITRVTKYDNKPSNDYKNISQRAFPLFRAGHVQSIEFAEDLECFYFKCICLPEMKKTFVYSIELTLDKDCNITSAKCGCPAGLGPHGSCKHIAATCYAIENFCRFQLEGISCTSQLQAWNQPRKRHLDSSVVTDIDFTQHEFGKVKRKLGNPMYDPRPMKFRSTSSEEVETLRSALRNQKEDLAILHVLGSSDRNAPLSPLACSSSSSLPQPSLARVKTMKYLHKLPHPLSLNNIRTACNRFIEDIKCSESVTHDIQEATRLQYNCEEWHIQRRYRITASNFGSVVKRKNPHPPLVKRFLYSSTSSINRDALQWGRDHEADAKLHYERTCLEPGYSLVECGLFVDKSGFLGATPDGMVVDKDNKPIRLIEIKCPHKHKDTTVIDACSSSSFFCKVVNDKPALKTIHNYYHQVQGQMAVTGTHQCDFIVWTTSDVSVERISFDNLFWTSICLPQLRNFYMNSMLPEIVYPRHPCDPITYTLS